MRTRVPIPAALHGPHSMWGKFFRGTAKEIFEMAVSQGRAQTQPMATAPSKNSVLLLRAGLSGANNSPQALGHVQGVVHGPAVDAGVSGRPAIHDKSAHWKHLGSAAMEWTGNE